MSNLTVWDRLSLPFDPKRVSWRVGSTDGEKKHGLALAYIDARDVMQRLDDVLGPENWQDRYEVHGGKTICYLSLRVSRNDDNNGWVTKADAAGDTVVEAEKGAVSDAFKRAAVKWGIGRYLYDLDSPWVEIEARGKSFSIKKDAYTRLEALLTQSDPEARAMVWAQNNLKIISAATKYEGSREILKTAGIDIKEV